MHCRGSDAAGSAAAAAAGRSAGTQQGRLRRPQDAGSAPDSGRRRHQTVHGHGEHALAPGVRRQRGRTGSAAAAALESTAAGDARGEAEEDASAPSSEASSVLCAVCLEEVRGRRAAAAEAEAITLPCSHAYHPGCVLPWLAVHHACPCCKAHPVA